MAEDALIRDLEVIGEASHNIEGQYGEFASTHPDLPLRIAYAMRNSVTPGYFKVDMEIVDNSIWKELPALYRQVHAGADELSGEIRIEKYLLISNYSHTPSRWDNGFAECCAVGDYRRSCRSRPAAARMRRNLSRSCPNLIRS